ncbi:MAG: TIGR04255 family protein [Candidatus Muirbacterium halophilum]|nr:TIGR04255 family protein [Candidatus Muirbacterium halophilum]MCK9477627.1 TIGR04255 family protein [Candidatus Muirbacterium halophilum]
MKEIFVNDNIPKKIIPSFVKEVIAEIRFDSNEPIEVIYGTIYKALKKEYPLKIDLPILQIPDNIRKQDLKLLNQPWYIIHNDDIKIQIGPKTISIANQSKYSGWDNFFDNCNKFFNELEKLKLELQINRFGLRFINVFNYDIYDKSTLELILNSNKFKSDLTYVRTKINIDDYNLLIQITNDALFNNDGEIKKVSIIDIDTSCININNFFEHKVNIIGEAHVNSKKLFFNLLKEDFINTLKPEY